MTSLLISSIMKMKSDASAILALRQPAARDLRFIATAIKINGHLERIGDMAVNIAEKVLLLNEEPQLKPLRHSPHGGNRPADDPSKYGCPG
jgi:phosphate uptake regulator